MATVAYLLSVQCEQEGEEEDVVEFEGDFDFDVPTEFHSRPSFVATCDQSTTRSTKSPHM
jgi:hypothetical protein